MPSYQKYIAMGHLTRDMEFGTTQAGGVSAKFGLAIDNGWGDKKSTLWLNCKAFGKVAERLQKCGPWNKGTLLLVEGELNCDEYEKDGVKKTYHWVNVRDWSFMERKSGGQRSDRGESRRQRSEPKQESLADWQASEPKPLAEDDIPF